MSKGWQLRSIGEICEVVNGGTPKTEIQAYWDGVHSWVTPAEMGKRSSPYIAETNRQITDEGLKNSSARLLPPYSVILSSRAPIGHLVINTIPMATNQGCKGLIPSSALNCKFLYYYLSSIVDYLNELGAGATFREISGGKLKTVFVPVPPLDEQKRIVEILDQAFASIAIAKANTEKNLANARELFESNRESFLTSCGSGWLEKPLAKLCEIKHGFAFKSEFFMTRGDYILLTPGNFYESGGYRDRGGKQKYYCGEIPQGYILNKGDLLVAMTEQAPGLLGSPIIVPESNKFLHNQRLGLIVSKSGIPWSNEFFFHVFNKRSFRREIFNSGTGVKVRHTSPTKIGEVMVPFPDSVEQQLQIVASLSDLLRESSRLEDFYTQRIAALDDLKQSLLHAAFTGQLTAAEPVAA